MRVYLDAPEGYTNLDRGKDFQIVLYDLLEATQALTTSDESRQLIDQAFDKLEALWDRISQRDGLFYTPEEIRLLWIDAICINQEDLNERAEQVPLMSDIYLNASILLVWLGVEDEYSRTSFSLVNSFIEDQMARGSGCSFETVFRKVWNRTLTLKNWLDEMEIPIESQEVIFVSLSETLSRGWTKRAWVKQEYALGSIRVSQGGGKTQRLLVSCGSSRARDFTVMSWLLWQGQPQSIGSILAAILYVSRAPVRQLSDDGASIGTLSWGQLALQFASGSRPLTSTDPKDKLYSILGLSRTVLGKKRITPATQSLVVSYKANVADVYVSFFKEVIETSKRLDILGCCKEGSRVCVGQTWCPDWTTGSFLDSQLSMVEVALDVAVGLDYVKRMAFDAAAGVACEASFTQDMTGLIVSGFIWDITSTKPSRFSNLEGEASLGNNDVRDRWRRLLKIMECYELSKHGLDVEQSLMSCLTMSEAHKKNKKEVAETEKILRSRGLRASTDQTEDGQRATLRTLRLWEWIDNVPGAPGSMNEVFHGVYIDSHGDTVLKTEKGNVVRPLFNSAQPGDLVCVILGCMVPILLRPLEGKEGFHNLGEVYVPVIMKGEAVKALERGEVKLRRFELY